ncbi:MAG TPA: hypothetical protein VK530_09720 [Candidatus Acidoferrum sp.]|nr:hypothetical protein [Candidatus Acidoferrum sp.]
MKTTLIITTAAALVALAPNSHALPPEVQEMHQRRQEAHQQAQEAHERVQEAHQRAFEVVKEIRDTLVPGPVIKFVETFPPIAGPRRAVLHLAQVDPSSAPGKPVPPRPPAGLPEMDPDAIAQWANDVAMTTTRNALGGVFGEGGKATKRPVIVGGDAKNISAIEEDLSVMMRILDKSAADGRDEKAMAMGINVFSFGDSSGSPRTFYIEGYGAMFIVKVKYPLLATPKGDETRTNETTNSEWERARQELYGVKSEGGRNLWREGPGEQFDEQRVENLQNHLTDDLANATHIRHLKADDWVSVVVLGGSRGAVTHGGGGSYKETARAGGRSGSGAGGSVSVRVSSGTQTTMILRAKKSDVDAFAKGKLKADEFRKKVSFQVY